MGRVWKAPVVVAALNVAAFVLFLSSYQPTEVGWEHSNVFDYWASQILAVWKYLGLVGWPVGLSIDHDFSAGPWWLTLLAAAALLLGGVVLWRLAGILPLVSLGFGWFFLSLAPSDFVPNTEAFNESRAYVGMAGISLAVACVIASRTGFSGKGIALALLCLMIPMTVSRNRLWKDDVAIWADAARTNPGKARVHYNLGAALAR